MLKYELEARRQEGEREVVFKRFKRLQSTDDITYSVELYITVYLLVIFRCGKVFYWASYFVHTTQ